MFEVLSGFTAVYEKLGNTGLFMGLWVCTMWLFFKELKRARREAVARERDTLKVILGNTAVLKDLKETIEKKFVNKEKTDSNMIHGGPHGGSGKKYKEQH